MYLATTWTAWDHRRTECREAHTLLDHLPLRQVGEAGRSNTEADAHEGSLMCVYFCITLRLEASGPTGYEAYDVPVHLTSLSDTLPVSILIDVASNNLENWGSSPHLPLRFPPMNLKTFMCTRAVGYKPHGRARRQDTTAC